MKYAKDLKWIRSRLVDDEVREKSVEKHIPRGEISAAVANARDLGQLVKTLEEFRHDPVRRLDTILFQDVKPDRVDVENGVLSKLEWVQTSSA
jgi:hypothetical protein